jgi:hypothetical protein
MRKARAVTSMFALGGVLAPVAVLASPVSASDAQSETITYRMKQGDSLYRLSEKYLAGRTAYVEIGRLNRIANPLAIAPGTTIRIPVRLLKATPLEAQLASYQGAVRIERSGAVVAPKIGMAINEGQIVETGALGFLTLALSNGSRVTLPSSSRVRILHMRQFLLTGSLDFDFALDKGRAETAVTPMKDKNSRFRLRTPIAVSAVRGTQFRIGYDPAQGPSLTEVVEGGVAVGTSTAPADPALVPAGFGATATADGKVGTERLLAAPTVLRAGKLQKEPDVSFDLAPVGSAAGYHVQLAKDAGFADTIAETRSVGPNVTFSQIGDGNYFVRAMAIAPSGLEGLSETYGVRRQLTALGASADATAPGEYQFKWFGSGSGKRSYRFELRDTAEGGVPLIDEAGLDASEIRLSGLAPGVYYWRVGVRQFGQSGVSENWTPPEKFTVSAPET